MCTRLGMFGSLIAVGLLASSVHAGYINNVVETGGDNEATDTITAKWTGQTWNVTVNNEPVPGLTVGTPFTAGTFGHGAPTFVDRNHRYADDVTNSLPIPAYLVGLEYIMSGNDNRDNGGYRLDVALNGPARVYMLIDNRLGKPDPADNTTAPVFDATHMQWIVDQGWIASANGLNRDQDAVRPDEVPIDESANGSIDQYYSVYYKDFQGGTATLLQADNAGRNMYGVVVGAIPEPASFSLLGLGALALLGRRSRR